MGRKDEDGTRHTKKTRRIEKKNRNPYSARSARIKMECFMKEQNKIKLKTCEKTSENL